MLCRTCREDKPADQFYVSTAGKTYTRCIPCAKQAGAAWRAANPGKIRKYSKAAYDRLCAEEPARLREYNRKAREKIGPEKRREMYRTWYAANPTKVRTQYIRKKYDMSYEEFWQMFETQEGLCAICSRLLCTCKSQKCPSRAFVDHRKGTSDVRGLLCRGCNSGIGMLQESPALFHNAVSYLEAGNQLQVKLRAEAALTSG